MLAQYKLAFAPALNDCSKLSQFVTNADRFEILPKNVVLGELV
jgi:hypothetical protein